MTKALEGMYDGAVHITTDYEVGRQSCDYTAVVLKENTTRLQFKADMKFSPPSDINHPSESRHRSGHVEQLSQTHRFTALISGKSS